MRAEALMAKAAQAAASAETLLAIGDTDGACSRAYFAMFDAARAALIAAGFDAGKTHRGVLASFSDHLVKDGPMPRDTGRLLKYAETFRYVADYSGEPVDASDAHQLVSNAHTFVAAVRTIFMLGGPR